MTINAKFKSIFGNAMCAATRFAADKGCFVHGIKSTRCRGLTRCLAVAWPLPTRHPTATCEYCKPARRRERAAFSRACGGLGHKNVAGPRTRVKDGGGGGKAAAAATTTAGSGMIPTRHGSLVDDQVVVWAEQGIAAARARWPRGLEACTLALIRHITETLRWVPVAAQVPLLLPGVGPRVATAVDLFCTDAATRSKVFLVEVKSTRDRQPGAADACYRAAPPQPAAAVRRAAKCGGLGPDAAYVPRSQHMLHQGQLWAMDWSLRNDYGVTPDRAVVLRARPGRVYEYALDRAWWDARCDALLLQVTLPMLPRKGKTPRKPAK